MQIVDSHCHLNLIEESGYCVDDIVRSADCSGVKIIQNISVCLSEFRKIYSYAEKFKNIFCSVGLHPLYCSDERFDYDLCENFCLLPKVNAIGECGLDYSRNPSIEEKRLQQKVFLQQIELADRYNLPLIIHTRDAEEKTYELLESSYRMRNQRVKGVMHCFTGTKEFAHAMIELGFYISFSGVVTFKKKVEHLQELVCELPIDRILVETDAPYLSPEPFRGQKNLPERTRNVVEKIAFLRGISPEEVASTTTLNYQKLFSKCKIDV
jgi:TatD DNase family protein